MHTELEETGKTAILERSIFIKRLLLNIVWWIFLVLAFFGYDQLSRRIAPDLSWSKAVIVFDIPFLVIQGILHWLTLKHFYPQKRISNILWVVVMPVLIWIGAGLVLLAILLIAVQQGFKPFD